MDNPNAARQRIRKAEGIRGSSGTRRPTNGNRAAGPTAHAFKTRSLPAGRNDLPGWKHAQARGESRWIPFRSVWEADRAAGELWHGRCKAGAHPCGELAAAVHRNLGEDGLQVVLDGVRGNE